MMSGRTWHLLYRNGTGRRNYLKGIYSGKGRLKSDEAINIAIQIAQGLEVAHQNHTIHRDIKPQNIIVSKMAESRLQILVLQEQLLPTL